MPASVPAWAGNVFLQGCGLPRAWSGQRQWRILEASFGQGMNFLSAWRAWQEDAARPGMLHYASIEARPISAADLLGNCRADADRGGLGEELARQWYGLTPGFHRLAFEDGRVLLTLCVGDLRDVLKQLAFEADSVFLDGSDPSLRDPQVLKAVARLCRRGTGVATSARAAPLRQGLAEAGFDVAGTHGLSGTWSPAWETTRARRGLAAEPGTCVVIGAGLAGAAAASSLARRGWQVEVLESAGAPAAGASGLPAGLLAAHQSPDDNLLSRLSRVGVRMTLRQSEVLLPSDRWRADGVLEFRGGDERLPPAGEGHAAWTRPATPGEAREARLASGAHAWWHEKAAWIRPGDLVRALLQQPGIERRFNTRVSRVDRAGRGWMVSADDGRPGIRADLVVVAAAHASNSLLPKPLPLHPVRGQVSWSHEIPGGMPPFPLNGNGHFLPQVMLEDGMAWLCGSTYGRGEVDRDERATDHAANLAKLAGMAPAAAGAVRSQFDRGTVQAWTGVRCTSGDRRPLAGEVAPGLWVVTAMGSRGLTFAILCGELVAARLHAEPLPLERRLADAIGTGRLSPPA